MKRKMSFDSPVLLFSTLFIASDSDSGEIMLTYASEKKPKSETIENRTWRKNFKLGNLTEFWESVILLAYASATDNQFFFYLHQ